MILYFDLTHHNAGVYKTGSMQKWNSKWQKYNRKRQICKNSKELKCGFGYELTKKKKKKKKPKNKTKSNQTKQNKEKKEKKKMCNLGPYISNHDTIPVWKTS